MSRTAGKGGGSTGGEKEEKGEHSSLWVMLEGS